MADARQEKLEAFVSDLMTMLAHGMINRLAPASTYHQMVGDADLLSPRAMAGMQALAMNSIQSSVDVYERLFRIGETITGSRVETLELAPWIEQISRSCDIRTELAWEYPPALTLDAGLWSIILTELFHNVGVHGGGQAHVTCRLDGERLILDVRDTGPGLSSYSAESFEESSRQVVRATRRRHDSPGQGLGFVHIRWAALLLDGDITLHKVTPHGLGVSVTASLVK